MDEAEDIYLFQVLIYEGWYVDEGENSNPPPRQFPFSLLRLA